MYTALLDVHYIFGTLLFLSLGIVFQLCSRHRDNTITVN